MANYFLSISEDGRNTYWTNKKMNMQVFKCEFSAFLIMKHLKIQQPMNKYKLMWDGEFYIELDSVGINIQYEDTTGEIPGNAGAQPVTVPECGK